MRKKGWQLNSEHCTSKRRYVIYQPVVCKIVCIDNFVLWSKMPMFQRAGMKEVGQVGFPLPPVLQYTYNSCDIKSIWFEFHHDICTALYLCRRPWQNRILILVFFRLRAQFYMYSNTLDKLQVFSSGWTCQKLCFSSSKLNWNWKRSLG